MSTPNDTLQRAGKSRKRSKSGEKRKHRKEGKGSKGSKSGRAGRHKDGEFHDPKEHSSTKRKHKRSGSKGSKGSRGSHRHRNSSRSSSRQGSRQSSRQSSRNNSPVRTPDREKSKPSNSSKEPSSTGRKAGGSMLANLTAAARAKFPSISSNRAPYASGNQDYKAAGGSPLSNHTHKILMIGNFSGKRTLYTKYTTLKFDATDHDEDIVDTRKKKQATVDGEDEILEIRVVSGDPDHKALRRDWFTWAEGIMLLYSINDKDSWADLKEIQADVERYGGHARVSVIGTKLDKSTQRVIATEKASKFASQFGYTHFETSSKDGTNVSTVFQEIVRAVVEAKTSGAAINPKDKGFFSSNLPQTGVDVSQPSTVKVKHMAKIKDNQLVWKAEDFTLKERLGKGSYGSVFRATWKDGSFVVAIKILTPGRVTNEDKIKNEYDTLRQCKNPYILNYYGVSFKDPEIWILTEYCECGSIHDIIKELDTVLNEQQIAYACYATLEALVYCHEQKHILHRDIKAANLMTMKDGSVKLGDFGVARIFTEDQDIQGTSTIMGTPHWMAPEIWEENYDYKADIWSLGITAYEMAQGLPPNADLGMMKIYMRVISEGPPRLPMDQKYSSDFRDFVAKCLTVTTAKRPTAKELQKHPFVAKAKSPAVLKPLVDKLLKRREKERARKGK